MPTASTITGKRRHRQADLELLHEPVADEGAHRERQTARDDRAQVAIREEHEQDDRRVDVQHHRQLAFLDFVVDCRQHAGVAGGEPHLDAGRRMTVAILHDGRDHGVDGRGLVVAEIRMDRRHAAILAQIAAHAPDLGGEPRVVHRVDRHDAHASDCPRCNPRCTDGASPGRTRPTPRPVRVCRESAS